MPGIDVCLMYINNGSVFGVLEKCAIDEKIPRSGAVHIYKDRNGNICEISIEVFES